MTKNERRILAALQKSPCTFAQLLALCTHSSSRSLTILLVRLLAESRIAMTGGQNATTLYIKGPHAKGNHHG